MFDWKEWKKKHLASLSGILKTMESISFRLEDLKEEFNLRYQVVDVSDEIIFQCDRFYTEEWKAWMTKLPNANTKEKAEELFTLLAEMKNRRLAE